LTASIPNYYNLRWESSDGLHSIKKVEQLIWSGGTSNKDGSLFERGVEVHRKNGYFMFASNTSRPDRMKQESR
jgi:hypothetical protein